MRHGVYMVLKGSFKNANHSGNEATKTPGSAVVGIDIQKSHKQIKTLKHRGTLLWFKQSQTVCGQSLDNLEV